MALTFSISLAAASEKDISVNFATADGTAATADNDYLGTSGSVLIAAGQTSASLLVFVVGDKRKEPDETFFVNLRAAGPLLELDQAQQASLRFGVPRRR